MSHKSEAKRLANRAHRAIESNGLGSATALATMAVAEATLALAEQQRVQNIIALSAHLPRGVRTDSGLTDSGDESKLSASVAELLEIERVEL